MKVHMCVIFFNEISVRYSLDRQSIGVLKKLEVRKGSNGKNDITYRVYVLC